MGQTRQAAMRDGCSKGTTGKVGFILCTRRPNRCRTETAHTSQDWVLDVCTMPFDGSYTHEAHMQGLQLSNACRCKTAECGVHASATCSASVCVHTAQVPAVLVAAMVQCSCCPCAGVATWWNFPAAHALV